MVKEARYVRNPDLFGGAAIQHRGLVQEACRRIDAQFRCFKLVFAFRSMDSQRQSAQ
jgi:hypothetical protein